MIYEKFYLTQHFPQLKEGTAGWEPNVTVYVPDNLPEIFPEGKRPAIIICPGGGYGFTSDREAEPVALSFLSANYNVFVLRYSVAPARYPQALLELSATVAWVRRNAEKYHVDLEKIAVCGFSAGGHLAGCLGVFWNESFIREKLSITEGENRPNAMILAYPVITAGEQAHRGSFENLLGQEASNVNFLNKLSLEKQVNDKTPPAFIWHTFNDRTVPVENALLMAEAMTKQGIAFELHIYPEGPHGLSLCERTTAKEAAYINEHAGSWVTLCKQWLKMIFRE